MPGNYGLNGNDWYNQRLNQIASMMSMQNTDPAYMAGALISRYFLKPQIQNFMQDKFLGNGGDDSGSNGTQFQQTNGKYEAIPTANGMASTGNATTDAAIAAFSPDNGVRQGINAGMPYTRDDLLDLKNNPLGYDYSGAMNAAREDINLARFAQEKSQQNQPAPAQPPQPPTQADMTEATNNDVNQAVTREAQAQSGGILSPLAGLGAQSIANQAAANVYGVPSFQQGSPLGNGGEPETVAGASSGIGDDVLRRALLGRALQAKQDYAVAQQNNDEQGMKQAHDAAEAVRQMAKEYGVEIPEAGADVTIDELANAMLIEGEKQTREAHQREAERLRNLTPQELLANPEVNINPNDFYQRAYQDAISKRIPEDMARQMASDAAMQYESRYVNAMQNEFNTQGIDPNTGQMNVAGIDSLMRIAAANNPEMAQMMMSQYASPRDMWNFNRDIDRARINEGLREQLAMYNWQNIEQPRMGYNAQLTDQLNANNAVRQLDAQMQLIDARARAAGLSEMAILNAKSQYISGLVNSGAITPEMGVAAMASMLGLGGGRNSNNGYSMTPKESIKFAGIFTSLVNDTMRRIRANDPEDSAEAMADYYKFVDENTPMLQAAGEQDTVQAMNDFKYVMNFAREDMAGNTQKAYEYYQAIRNDPDLLSQLYGFDLDKYERMYLNKNKNKNNTDEEDSTSNNNIGFTPGPGASDLWYAQNN